MDCRQFRETFSDFLDGLLDEAGEIRARGHLSSCGSCRRLDAAYRAGVSALENVPRLRVSPDFGARLRRRIMREPLIPSLVGSYGFAGGLLMVTLAALLILDLKGRLNPRTSPDTAAADSIASPVTEALDSGADLVTVRVAGSWYDAGSIDPYSTPASLSALATAPVRFEVPAIWSAW